MTTQIRPVGSDRLRGGPLFDAGTHEAWNDGDVTRVVLLFEVWRLGLSAVERAALTTLFGSIGDYGAKDEGA